MPSLCICYCKLVGNCIFIVVTSYPCRTCLDCMSTIVFWTCFKTHNGHASFTVYGEHPPLPPAGCWAFRINSCLYSAESTSTVLGTGTGRHSRPSAKLGSTSCSRMGRRYEWPHVNDALGALPCWSVTRMDCCFRSRSVRASITVSRRTACSFLMA